MTLHCRGLTQMLSFFRIPQIYTLLVKLIFLHFSFSTRCALFFLTRIWIFENLLLTWIFRQISSLAEILFFSIYDCDVFFFGLIKNQSKHFFSALTRVRWMSCCGVIEPTKSHDYRSFSELLFLFCYKYFSFIFHRCESLGPTRWDMRFWCYAFLFYIAIIESTKKTTDCAQLNSLI